MGIPQIHLSTSFTQRVVQQMYTLFKEARDELALTPVPVNTLSISMMAVRSNSLTAQSRGTVTHRIGLYNTISMRLSG